jgi:hypothetical protein
MKEIARLTQAREQMTRRLNGRRSSSSLPTTVELVLSRPIVSAPMIAKVAKVTQRGALNLIGRTRRPRDDREGTVSSLGDYLGLKSAQAIATAHGPAVFTRGVAWLILFSQGRMIMSAAARVYTPAEAAAVSQIGIKAVHNA